MLGPDWQVDVTDLVQDSLKVMDPRVAELVDHTVLVALEQGSTTLKVRAKGYLKSNFKHREIYPLKANDGCYLFAMGHKLVITLLLSDLLVQTLAYIRQDQEGGVI